MIIYRALSPRGAPVASPEPVEPKSGRPCGYLMARAAVSPEASIHRVGIHSGLPVLVGLNIAADWVRKAWPLAVHSRERSSSATVGSPTAVMLPSSCTHAVPRRGVCSAQAPWVVSLVSSSTTQLSPSLCSRAWGGQDGVHAAMIDRGEDEAIGGELAEPVWGQASYTAGDDDSVVRGAGRLAVIAVAVDDGGVVIESESADRFGHVLGCGDPGLDGDHGRCGDGGDQRGVVAGAGTNFEHPHTRAQVEASSIRAISVGADDEEGGPPSCPVLVSSDWWE